MVSTRNLSTLSTESTISVRHRYLWGKLLQKIRAHKELSGILEDFLQLDPQWAIQDLYIYRGGDSREKMCLTKAERKEIEHWSRQECRSSVFVSD